MSGSLTKRDLYIYIYCYFRYPFYSEGPSLRVFLLRPECPEPFSQEVNDTPEVAALVAKLKALKAGGNQSACGRDAVAVKAWLLCWIVDIFYSTWTSTR